LLAIPGPLTAQRVVPSPVDPDVLATITDDDPQPLPRSLAPWELVPLRVSGPDGLVPPAGPVRTYAEYEPNRGLLIRWGSFNDVLTAMTVAVTTASRPARMWIVVSGSSQQNSATTALGNAGANLDWVDFIHAPTDSVWIRDYGPRFIDDDGTLAIVDHTYNRPRPNDDALPAAIAAAWGVPRYEIPLVHGGGNFHLFATGEAFMTELIEDENPSLSTVQIEEAYLDYQGLDVEIGAAFPSTYDSTQHIDMWMLPARDRAALVGSYTNSGASAIPHAVTEAMTADLEGRGWNVTRFGGFRATGTHYTWANAVILDAVVLVPQFDPYPTQNADALSAFATLFPGRDIIGINATQLVTFAGVLHCIVMHVPAPRIFSDGFESGDTAAWTVGLP
jgi:agmatine/peptidylarginine deiminase